MTAKENLFDIDARVQEFSERYAARFNAAVTAMNQFVEKENAWLEINYGLSGMLQPPGHIGQIQGAVERLQLVFDGIISKKPFGAGDSRFPVSPMFGAYKWVASVMEKPSVSEGKPLSEEAAQLVSLMADLEKDKYFETLVADLSV